MNTHNKIVDFGRHKGVRYTRVPVSYLKWMVNSGHSRADIADAELKRRGTVTPKLEISGHAIDRASQYLLKAWSACNKDADEFIGFHSWLHEKAWKALNLGAKCPRDANRRIYLGFRFVFELDGVWPVLKTVMKEKESERRRQNNNADGETQGEGIR